MDELKGIEFYNTPDGGINYKKINDSVRELTIASRPIVQSSLTYIKNHYSSDTFIALSDLYSKYERNRDVFEFNMVHRFIRCNFGEYDTNSIDIDTNGLWHLEEVKCPLRGECSFEGVICKPTVNTVLSDREKQIMKLIANGKQTSEIANELFISPLTVNHHRESIKIKLKLRGVAEITSYYFKYLQNEF